MNIEASLNIYEALLFMIVTVIITACGYLINDYYDFEIDEINHKIKSRFSKNHLFFYFFGLSILGLLISFYLAFKLERIHLVLLYPTATIVLYYYSKRLKLLGFVGNVVVALFCGMTTLILLLAEPQLTINSQSNISFVVLTIWAFSIFAFMINLLREVVKDIEDMKGDYTAGSKSLPLKIGINKTKVLIYFNTTVLIILIIVWTFTDKGMRLFEIQMFNLIFLIAPLIMSMLKLKKAIDSNDYHKLSTLYKWIMLSGLFAVLLIANHLNN